LSSEFSLILVLKEAFKERGFVLSRAPFFPDKLDKVVSVLVTVIKGLGCAAEEIQLKGGI